MHFSIVTVFALLATLVSADDSPITKKIDVHNMYVRNINDAITRASFTIQPDNINCNASASEFGATIHEIRCTSTWSFILEKKKQQYKEYEFSVYQTTSTRTGAYIYDTVHLTLACREGSNVAKDFICEFPPSTAFTSMILDASGGPSS